MSVMKVAGAQLPNVVGDLEGNTERILDAMRWAEDAGADLLVLPELSLTGYPLSDLVLHDEFVAEAQLCLDRLAKQSGQLTTLVGTVTKVPKHRRWDTRDRDVAISAALVSGGELRGVYHKVLLPLYDVFDEARNFAPGQRPDALWLVGDVVTGVAICEDLWSGDGPPEAQSAAGAQILLVPNASPYHRGKAEGRLTMTSRVARRNGIPVVYLNFVGGQDELVFDGGSIIVDRDGELIHRAAEFVEDRFVVDVEPAEPRAVNRPVTTVHTRPLPERLVQERPALAPVSDRPVRMWKAVVTATHDFCHKNGFRLAVLGLSGGIDSAVTVAVAAEALGPDNVLAVNMPGPDSPADEEQDAEKVARNLGVEFNVIPVEQMTQALTKGLEGRIKQRAHAGTRADLTVRARAAILSAIAEEEGRLVLATTNKSELSIGVAAVAGDLVGGFAPLRDCPKTQLYELARYRNGLAPTIPEDVIGKRTTMQRYSEDPPPPYSTLDPIVERYIEHGEGLEQLVAAGFEADTVVDILRRIDDAEFVRRSAPVGVKLTARAFEQDRRMPISNAWRPHRRR